MSTGGAIGGILGAIIGGLFAYFTGGLSIVAGVLIGGSIGYTIGTVIDPQKPDVRTAGVPIQALSFMSNTIGDPLPDLLGTGKIIGHLLCFGKERTEAIWQRVGGKGGSGSHRQFAGWNYYASWAVGICLGPIDSLYTIFRDSEEVVWHGEAICPVSGGKQTIVISGIGSVDFYFGTDDHALNTKLGECIVDPTLNFPYRNLCFAFFDNCLLGGSNRIPSMQFVIRKSPVLAFSPFNQIQTHDYNPAHAMWYILKSMTGFPEQWLDPTDFTDFAEKLALENRGISLLIDSLQACLNYIENINTHIDGILRYGSDGKFHPKLIRNDYVLGDLLLIDESMLLEEPEISRKSWIDTINEMKVQYSEITGRVTPVGQYLGLVPLHLEVDGDYIYVCGKQAYSVEGNNYYYAAVRKMSINDLLIVDEFDLHQATNNVNNQFNRVLVDGDDLYLVGSSYVDGKVQTVITKRDKNDLAIELWTNYYYLGDSAYSINGGMSCIADNEYLYVTETWEDGINHQAAWRQKLNKLDGSLIWGGGHPSTMTGYDGIADDGTNIIIAGSAGGDRSIEKVNKISNASTIYNISRDRYINHGIILDGDVYFVCGQSYNESSQPRVSVLKYSAAFANVWEWVKDYLAGNLDEALLNCIVDGSGVYSIGYLQYNPAPAVYYYQGIFAKVSLDGSPLWDLQHETQYRAASRAIGLLDADTFVVGTYDNNPSVSIVDRYGYLEKRSVSTGLVIT